MDRGTRWRFRQLQQQRGKQHKCSDSTGCNQELGHKQMAGSSPVVSTDHTLWELDSCVTENGSSATLRNESALPLWVERQGLNLVQLRTLHTVKNVQFAGPDKSLAQSINPEHGIFNIHWRHLLVCCYHSKLGANSVATPCRAYSLSYLHM